MVTYTDAPVTLEAGDNLTREEFHRRYLARPDIKKAELIDGVVYLPSPVRFDRHSRPQFIVVGWLALYVALHPGVRPGSDNGTVLLDKGDHEVQPDAFLWRPEEGRALLNEDNYLVGAPDLVVEVAASSVSCDLHQKKDAYRRNGVPEYIVWRVENRAIDWPASMCRLARSLGHSSCLLVRHAQTTRTDRCAPSARPTSRPSRQLRSTRRPRHCS